MIRRLPSDAALLALALAVLALVIGATFGLHHVFVGDGDQHGVTADVRTAGAADR